MHDACLIEPLVAWNIIGDLAILAVACWLTTCPAPLDLPVVLAKAGLSLCSVLVFVRILTIPVLVLVGVLTPIIGFLVRLHLSHDVRRLSDRHRIRFFFVVGIILPVIF